MSSGKYPIWRALIVLTIAVLLLSGAYFGAWFYTSSYARLTPAGTWPTRTSPAPFVVVETTGGEATAKVANGSPVVRPFESTRVLLWFADHELEVIEHVQYR